MTAKNPTHPSVSIQAGLDEMGVEHQRIRRQVERKP